MNLDNILCELRHLEAQAARVPALEAHELAVAQACGVSYEADGVSSAPGPRDQVIEYIRRQASDAGQLQEARLKIDALEAELAARNDVAVRAGHGTRVEAHRRAANRTVGDRMNTAEIKMPAKFRLSYGTHSKYSKGTCALELVDYLDRKRRGVKVSGESSLTDAPACVSRVIRSFVVSWNDGLGQGEENDEKRTRLLGPLLPLLLDTATTGEDEETRAWMATDWLARVHAPAFLELAGLHEIAAQLRALRPLVDDASASSQQEILSAAWSAAWSAARSAARSAALSAAWSAALSAARSAALSAARSAARSAALSAAESAAWSAAWSALDPVVATLQASAVELVKAMCAVGRETA